MAHFTCKFGNTYYPFGKASKENILEAVMKTRDSKRTSEFVPFTSIPMILTESMQADGDQQSPKFSNEMSVYEDLCDNTLDRIFMGLVDAKLIPTFQYLKKSDSISLRYFTSSSVNEYIIPLDELRTRDPRSGNVRGAANTPSRCGPLHFDIRGNYGLAITWGDGQNSDIYPFDVLKLVAENTPNK